MILLQLLQSNHLTTPAQDYIVRRLGYDYDDETVENHMREADVDG